MAKNYRVQEGLPRREKENKMVVKTLDLIHDKKFQVNTTPFPAGYHTHCYFSWNSKFRNTFQVSKCTKFQLCLLSLFYCLIRIYILLSYYILSDSLPVNRSAVFRDIRHNIRRSAKSPIIIICCDPKIITLTDIASAQFIIAGDKPCWMSIWVILWLQREVRVRTVVTFSGQNAISIKTSAIALRGCLISKDIPGGMRVHCGACESDDRPR